MTGLNYVKMPRSVSEYTLMKGVTDFSNLKQFDLFESGYSFLTVISTPKFMQTLASQDPNGVGNLENGLIHIMEGEFKGLSGLSSITADAGEISNGANSIQVINNVNFDTSQQVSMEFYERSGSLITKYMEYYMTGIKDPYSKAKTYHGLIGSSINDPGPDYEVFNFLYYVTDNTMRKVEKAFLLANAQPTEVPYSDLYNSTKGTYDYQTINLTFNCFVIVGDTVNKYAAMMLENDLNTTDTDRKIILDSNNYQFNTLDTAKDSGFSRVGDVLSGSSASVESDTAAGKPLGDNTKIS